MKKFLSVLMVVAMLFVIAIPVAAEISPKPDPVVDAGTVPEDGGNVDKIVNEDGTITLIVKPEDGYNFIKWEIDGEYEIIKGELTDKTITIKPNSDVKADAKLEKVQDVKPTPKPPVTSPSTGVAPVLCAVAMVVSMAGAGYSFKKSSK